ncbi:ABC transporter permease subunit [Flavobacteriaceae bacterium]|nr:ABC transporter permease subunit [Flavobacteriaceae bacterium]
MWSIAKRELHFYFSNLTGYLVIGSYLLINTLFLWFFDTPFQLLNSGFGDLTPFFEMSPWLLLLLIPALSMRSFSEERTTGTLELLLTKPLRPVEIFGGKFIGVALILFIALIPTSLNIVAINALLEHQSELDWGSFIASYLALILVALLFLCMSLCCSLIFRNQVTSFLMAVLVCFTQFFVWNFLADFSALPWVYEWISDLGIQTHYSSLSRGVLQIEDLIYLFGLIAVFYILGVELIKKEQV